MKRLLWSILSLVVILSGCGKDGGGGNETPAANLSGTWRITAKNINNDCGNPNGVNTQENFQIVQDGNNLKVIDNQGNSFKGTISGTAVSWSGSFPEDGGTTTITDLSLTVSSDGKSLNGTSTWTWTDGSTGCQGTTSFNGSLLTPASTGGGSISGTGTVGGAGGGLPVISEVEPNNSFGQAQVLNVLPADINGVAKQGDLGVTISFPSNPSIIAEDVYTFTLSTQKRLAIGITTNGQADFDLFLFGGIAGNAPTVVAQKRTPGTAAEVIDKILSPGTYFVIVDAFNNTANVSYKVRIVEVATN